jgi:LysM repeat protein
MTRKIRLFAVFSLLAVLGTACAPGGYWIPPSAPPGALIAVSALLDTPAAPTWAPFEPRLTQTPTPPVDPGAEATLTAAAGSENAEGFNASPTPLQPPATETPIIYYAQAADTLPVVAIRFGVQPGEIASPDPLPEAGFIKPGQMMFIPRRLSETTPADKLIPDSEIVYSPSTTDFDIAAYLAQAGGKLRTYHEWLKSTGLISGAQVVTRVAVEDSINPRLLLALLEFHNGWVFGEPATQQALDYPLNHVDPGAKSLFRQLVWAVNQLSTGYYAYREGRLTELVFPDGSTQRLAPDLNAGTVALQYYFAQHYGGSEWLDALQRFSALYNQMYGDPWARASTVEPLFPPGLSQPPLSLPFARNWPWSYTGGPHGAWEQEGAYAALDFAPGTIQGGCTDSSTWALASAAGLVVRSGRGLVVLDLDGDGREQTGWVLVYLHVSTDGRLPVGTWVDADDVLGRPSCEGGFATGTHIHIARKYNGEWIPADGPLPFNLGGWIAHAGDAPYKGTLTRDGQTITACTCSSAESTITRGPDDP